MASTHWTALLITENIPPCNFEFTSTLCSSTISLLHLAILLIHFPMKTSRLSIIKKRRVVRQHWESNQRRDGSRMTSFTDNIRQSGQVNKIVLLPFRLGAARRRVRSQCSHSIRHLPFFWNTEQLLIKKIMGRIISTSGYNSYLLQEAESILGNIVPGRHILTEALPRPV